MISKLTLSLSSKEKSGGELGGVLSILKKCLGAFSVFGQSLTLFAYQSSKSHTNFWDIVDTIHP